MSHGNQPLGELSKEETRDALRTEYLWLATLLDGGSADAWATPSLCAGWTVREVVAHITMPVRTGFLTVLAGVIRKRGDFNAYADQAARRGAQLPTTELVSALRDPRLHSWTPPGGGLTGALVHTVVHSLDVARPLRVGHQRAPSVLRAVLDDLVAPRSQKFFGFDERSKPVTAADIDWSFGVGWPLVTDAESAVLHLAGRLMS